MLWLNSDGLKHQGVNYTGYVFVSLTQPRVTWEEGISDEKFGESTSLVCGKFSEHFIDKLLM